MQDDAPLEDLVARYLDLREADPALVPEAYAAQYPARSDALLRAIRSALDVSALLPEPDPPGALERGRLGEYRLLREIGRGGMGIVFEAERDGSRYAVKWLPNAPLLGPRAVERVKREASALARLRHPNVVGIKESGTDGGAPFLVMDLVEGEPLSALVGRLSPAEAARIVATLARAVQAVHERGVLHRDLKPQNVVVRPTGEPVLLDFGLVAADDLPSLTSTGDLLGTPRYMAPEQVKGLPADARTDVHALGMILYELATGRAVHEGDTRDRVLEAVAGGDFVAPRRVRKDLPRDLEKVTLVALALDPRRRYPTAAALAADLDRFLGNEPVLARPPGPVARTAALVRRYPARAGLVAATALLSIAIVVAATTWSASKRSILERERIAGLVDAGVVSWLDGDHAAAAKSLSAALASDPSQPVAAALLAHVGGASVSPSAAPPAELIAEGLARLAAEDSAGAETAFAAASGAVPKTGGGALVAAGLGLAKVERRDWEGAVGDLQVAAASLPSSRRLARDLGNALRRTSRFEPAEKEYRRAIALEPESGALWTELAETLLQAQSLDAALVAAREAVRFSKEGDPDALSVLAGALDAKGERDAARETLRTLIASHPKHATARLRLAISFDTDHLVVEARDAYLAAIEVAPRNPTALAFFANLLAGADRGQCRGCDEAYSRHGDVLDPALARDTLVRAIDADRGRSQTLHNTVVQIALKIADRGPIISKLEELIAGGKLEPGQPTIRLDWVLRRLRMAEGEPR